MDTFGGYLFTCSTGIGVGMVVDIMKICMIMTSKTIGMESLINRNLIEGFTVLDEIFDYIFINRI